MSLLTVVWNGATLIGPLNASLVLSRKQRTELGTVVEVLKVEKAE